MIVRKIKIENYRLLKNFTVDLESELSLVIGKNNTGKTTLLTVLDEFINGSDKNKFSFDDLKYIFENNTDKNIARVKLAKWFNEVEESKFKSFNTISNTIQNHYETILNYFQHRSTNASAESFNAKIKAFRAQFRGVRDIEFFLFRLCNIYA